MPNESCTWIYSKGPNKGKQCNRKSETENDRCSKHKHNTGEAAPSIKSDKESIVSTVDIPASHEEYAESICSMSENNANDGDNILLCKYFVYDCIKEFFRDQKDISELLGQTKKSSGSNMTTMMMMAGIGCLPILLKNLTNTNILDALHKSENVNPTCPDARLFEGSQIGNSTTVQENTQGRTQTGTYEIRANQVTPEILSEADRRYGSKC